MLLRDKCLPIVDWQIPERLEELFREIDELLPRLIELERACIHAKVNLLPNSKELDEIEKAVGRAGQELWDIKHVKLYTAESVWEAADEYILYRTELIEAYRMKK
jgi:predicted HAD superfamily phosphohydrolase